jgi:hypothetical protein
MRPTVSVEDLPAPPEDEGWAVWHRAASEQAATAASGLTADPSATLWRAADFAKRALAHATPLQAIFTRSLLDGVANVREALERGDVAQGLVKEFDGSQGASAVGNPG